MDSEWLTGKSGKCDICGEDLVWWHSVDCTNNEGVFVKPQEYTRETKETCPHCTHTHVTKVTYKIPGNYGGRVEGVQARVPFGRATFVLGSIKGEEFATSGEAYDYLNRRDKERPELRFQEGWSEEYQNRYDAWYNRWYKEEKCP